MTLTFVHFTDSHIGPTKDFLLEGVSPFERTAAVIDAIRALPVRPDFVLHSGDIANHSSFAAEGAYELARELFARLELPLYIMAGNHDDQNEMRKRLALPEVERLDTPNGRYDYRFRAKNIPVLVLDPRIGDTSEGELLEEQFAYVERLIGEREKFLLFIHHLVVDSGVPWHTKYRGLVGDDTMLIKNGERLHALLAAAPQYCAGVFSGHIHASFTLVRDGIVYSCAPSSSIQIGAEPGVAKVQFEPALAGFHIVQIGPFGTTVTPQWVTG